MSEECRSSDISSWISSAIRRNVGNLVIQLNPIQYGSIKLPHNLFTSKFLTSLKLEFSCRIFNLPDQINLPALTTLYLGYIGLYSRNDSLNRLFLGCFALENIVLIRCRCHYSACLNINAAQLRYLRIEYCNSEIVVSARKLVSFSWTMFTDDNCSVEFENFSTLESAQFYFYRKDEDLYYDTKDLRRIIKCLKGLYNVEYLILPAYVLQVVSLYRLELEQWHSPFTKLRVLHLETWLKKGCFEAFVFLLKNSPNLESLDLDMDPHKYTLDKKEDLERVGSSLKLKMNHLKYIAVKEVIGSDLDLPYLKFLLELPWHWRT